MSRLSCKYCIVIFKPYFGYTCEKKFADIHPSKYFFFLTNIEIYGVSIVGGVYNFLDSVSLQQKFEATVQCYNPWIDQCYSPRTDQCYSCMLQLSFIWKIKKNTSSRCEGMPTQKTKRCKEKGERLLALWLLFLCFFLLPLGLPYVNWASQECCLFYLRSSLQSSDLPLFYFHELFPSLSFSHHHSGLLFPILTT